ncbi:MAG: ATP-binding protein [Actinomycetales bacterium]|nr:ATP-binding protein [Candidatus Phosphoribacter baldrii]
MVDYVPRHVDAVMAAALGSAPILILDGPRGVGKTTSAARLVNSMVTFPRDLAAVDADPDGYLSALTPPVLIDEWQLAGVDLLWTIKRIVDADPAPGRFLLTGSVEPATYGPTYPLTGRAVRVVMRPLSHQEFLGRGDQPCFLTRLHEGQAPALGGDVAAPLELTEIARPGFPAVRGLADGRLFYDAYTAVVAQRAGDEGRDSSRLLRTLRVLGTLTAQAVPDQRIWDAADINKATWKHYDDLVSRIHLSAPAPPFENNRLKRLTGYPKRFMADTGMAMALSDLSVHDLVAEPSLAGRYLESWVMQQLRPQVDVVGGHLSHLRTGAGEREVDAVIEVGRSVIALEVKLGTRPVRDDARQLQWLRDQLGDRFTHGFVVHTGSACYPLGSRLLALPAGLLTGSPP